MMAFPSMLFEAADKVGMSRPADKWDEDWTDELKNEFPHFFVYCQLQLGRPIVWGEHWENAKIIANIPVDKLKTMYIEDFVELGLSYAS